MKEASKNDFFAYMLLQIWAVAPISSSAFCSSSLALCSAGLGFELVTAGRFRFEKPVRLCLGGLTGQTRFRFSFNSPLNAAPSRAMASALYLLVVWFPAMRLLFDAGGVDQNTGVVADTNSSCLFR